MTALEDSPQRISSFSCFQDNSHNLDGSPHGNTGRWYFFLTKQHPFQRVLPDTPVRFKRAIEYRKNKLHLEYLATEKRRAEHLAYKRAVRKFKLKHQRVDECLHPGKKRYFHCKHCGDLISIRPRCHSRYFDACPYCARLRANRTARRAAIGIQAMKTPGMLTLTLHPKAGRAENMERLLSCFHALRAEFCRERVRGRSIDSLKPVGDHWERDWPIAHPAYRWDSWIGFIEIAKCQSGYIVHIHAVVDSSPIDERLLACAWEHITKDSFIVEWHPLDFSRYGYKSVIRYVVKYMTKSFACDDGTFTNEEMKHLFQSYGLPKTEKHHSLCGVCGATDSYEPFEPDEKEIRNAHVGRWLYGSPIGGQPYCAGSGPPSASNGA